MHPDLASIHQVKTKALSSKLLKFIFKNSFCNFCLNDKRNERKQQSCSVPLSARTTEAHVPFAKTQQKWKKDVNVLPESHTNERCGTELQRKNRDELKHFRKTTVFCSFDSLWKLFAKVKKTQKNKARSSTSSATNPKVGKVCVWRHLPLSGAPQCLI